MYKGEPNQIIPENLLLALLIRYMKFGGNAIFKIFNQQMEKWGNADHWILRWLIRLGNSSVLMQER